MKSKIYRDLTSKKLNEVTIDDVDTFRQGFYAQGRKNKRAYDELQQVAIASNQQGGSGSVPGTGQIYQVGNIYDNKSSLFSPTIGTWIVEAVSFETSGGSGTYNLTLRILDKVTGAEMPLPSYGNEPYNLLGIELDLNMTLEANITGGGSTPTSAVAYAYVMRRR
jgi:hypothetical protein